MAQFYERWKSLRRQVQQADEDFDTWELEYELWVLQGGAEQELYDQDSE